MIKVIRGLAPGKITVVMADMKASHQSSEEIVTHSLGSCLGITVYDPALQVGAMLHALLPDSTIDPEKAGRLPFIFVNTGLPLLFRSVFELGGVRSRLQVKAAGGAEMMASNQNFNVGERNFTALNDQLTKNGFKLAAFAVGGKSSRTMRLSLSTGSVFVDMPGQEKIVL